MTNAVEAEVVKEMTIFDVEEIASSIRSRIITSIRNLRNEIVADLRKIHSFYSSQGFRSDLYHDYKLPTWTSFCCYIGINKRTADRWINDYYDVEEDRLLTMEERVERRKQKSTTHKRAKSISQDDEHEMKTQSAYQAHNECSDEDDEQDDNGHGDNGSSDQVDKVVPPVQHTPNETPAETPIDEDEIVAALKETIRGLSPDRIKQIKDFCLDILTADDPTPDPTPNKKKRGRPKKSSLTPAADTTVDNDTTDQDIDNPAPEKDVRSDNNIDNVDTTEILLGYTLSDIKPRNGERADREYIDRLMEYEENIPDAYLIPKGNLGLSEYLTEVYTNYTSKRSRN